ncbi:MAG: CYTH domain-containing protein [Candidatus Delongbacteria bacterium]
MKQEIERRFLVADPAALGDWPAQRLVQGYLSRDPGRTVRLRLSTDEQGCERGWLTVKGPTRLEAGACVRTEWEVELPPAEVRAGLALCLPSLLEKTRLRVEHAGHVWEVDVFQGANAGLVLAEIELEGPDESFATPPWLGEEISADPRYSNACLSDTPWNRW